MKRFFIIIAAFCLILSESTEAIANQGRDKKLPKSKPKKNAATPNVKQSKTIENKTDYSPKTSLIQKETSESTADADQQKSKSTLEEIKQFWNTHKSTIIGNGLAAVGLLAAYKYWPKSGLLLAAGGIAANNENHPDPTIVEMKFLKKIKTGNKALDTVNKSVTEMGNRMINDFINHPITEIATFVIPFAGGARLAHFAGKALLNKGWNRLGSATVKSRFWAPLLGTMPLIPPVHFAWDTTFGDTLDKHISRRSRKKLNSYEDGLMHFMN